jgi:selenocysteine lyase/cysteine desulfurase
MQRRQFLAAGFSSITSSLLLSHSAKAKLSSHVEQLSHGIARTKPDKDPLFWQNVKQQFPLQKDLYYFNNASLGPSPNIVNEAVQQFRLQLESFPSKYMWGGWKKEKEQVREKVAAMLKASPEEIALIHNATEGMNLVASSLELKPGDEVILANHEHPSGTIPWQYWQQTKGIKLVRPNLPLLPKSKAEIIDIYRRAITHNTKVISIVHITNTNGMILPLKEITDMAHEKGILVAVDGAQAMGMIPLNLPELGVDFYTASSHKWLFSPKGMGVFYAKKASQYLLKPLIVASGYEDKSIRRLENYNSRNLPELLGLGVSIDFHHQIDEQQKYQRILQLKHYMRRSLTSNHKFLVKTPESDELSAGIICVEVKGTNVRELNDVLTEQSNINCRPMDTHNLNGLRFSLCIYNMEADIDYLVNSLQQA